MTKQQGIALILVLMLTMLLSIIAIGFQTHTRKMVDRLEKQTVLTELEIQLNSEFNKLIYRFLTTGKLYQQTNYELNYTVANSQTNVRLRVTNYSSKLSLFDIQENELRKALAPLIDSPLQLDQAVDSFFDWIDSDNSRRINGWESADYERAGRAGSKNGPITSIQEVKLIRGFESFSIAKLERMFTVYPVLGLDRAYADNTLLSQFFTDDILSRLEAARDSGDYSRAVYKKITGDSEPGQESFGAHFLKLEFELTKNDVAIFRTFDVSLSPFRTNPFNVYRTGP